MKKGIASVVLAAALVAYVVLGVLAHAQQWFFFDPPVTRFFQGFRNPVLDGAMETISYPGYPPQFLGFFGAVVVVLVALKRWIEAAIMAVGLAVVGGVGFVVKPLVHRFRPPSSEVWVADPWLLKADRYSFTAGHVHTYMVVVGWCVFLAVTLLPRGSMWRRAVVVAGVAFLVVMGFARFYLGDHWFSDVVGAYLLGTVGLSLEILGYGWVKRRWPNRVRPAVS